MSESFVERMIYDGASTVFPSVKTSGLALYLMHIVFDGDFLMGSNLG